MQLFHDETVSLTMSNSTSFNRNMRADMGNTSSKKEKREDEPCKTAQPPEKINKDLLKNNSQQVEALRNDENCPF